MPGRMKRKWWTRLPLPTSADCLPAVITPPGGSVGTETFGDMHFLGRCRHVLPDRFPLLGDISFFRPYSWGISHPGSGSMMPFCFRSVSDFMMRLCSDDVMIFGCGLDLVIFLLTGLLPRPGHAAMDRMANRHADRSPAHLEI